MLRILVLLPVVFLVLLNLCLLYARQNTSEARLIAHSDFWDGPRDIHLKIPDTPHPKRNLTRHPGTDTQPTWSPDGKWIAFVSDRDDSSGHPINSVYIIHPNGSELRKIGLASPATGTRVVSWSPDSEWLYVRYITRGWWDSYFVRIADGYTQTLRFNSTFNMVASWSPTSEWLAYRTGLDDDAQTAIARVHPNDRSNVAEAETLFTTGNYIDLLFWSPDGEWIAFTSFARQGNFFLYRMRQDGSDLNLLHTSQSPYVDVVWSPDSKQINFINDNTIYTVSNTSNPISQLFLETRAAYSHLAWSPTGAWLVYTIHHQTHDLLYRIHPKNKLAELLENHPHPINRIVWSDEWIFFTSGARGQAQLYRIRPDGSHLGYLTDVGFEWDFPVSPVIDLPLHSWQALLIGILMIYFCYIRRLF